MIAIAAVDGELCPLNLVIAYEEVLNGQADEIIFADSVQRLSSYFRFPFYLMALWLLTSANVARLKWMSLTVAQLAWLTGTTRTKAMVLSARFYGSMGNMHMLKQFSCCLALHGNAPPLEVSM